MKVNSSNPYQNLALSYTAKDQNLNLASPKENEISNLQRSDNILNFDFNQKSYGSEFGFRTDEKGFFTKDLNKISNLPLSYEINIKSVRNIAKEFIKQNENLNYQNLDLPFILNQYYNALAALNPEFKADDNAHLSRVSISELVQGFSTQNGEFSDSITRIYQRKEDLNQALNSLTSLNTLMLDNKIINFHLDKTLSNTSNNEILKPYLNKNAQPSKSGILLNFIYQDLKDQNNREFNFFMKPASLDNTSHSNLYKILKGEQNVDDFLKQNNEQKMSFDLYLYVNGIDKHNTSNDKLSVFFQQYINYEKNMDLKEFTNSSSIFQIYINETQKEFNELQKQFQKQSQDQETLKQANEQRQKNTQKFLDHRLKQANLNKILNSYFEVMA